VERDPSRISGPQTQTCARFWPIVIYNCDVHRKVILLFVFLLRYACSGAQAFRAFEEPWPRRRMTRRGWMVLLTHGQHTRVRGIEKSV
jgi:hypothetical protein